MGKLRIVSWNCNAKLGEKERNEIFDKKGDIYIIQECKKDYKDISAVPYVGWYGDEKESQRGIGIFSSKYEFEPLFKKENIKYRFVLPFRVTGENVNFILFAIWTKKYSKEDPFDYIEHVYHAITDKEYIKYLNEPTILIGDFNSNKIWDEKYKNHGNHSEVEEVLKKYDIFDVCKNKLEKAAIPTFYWRYSPDAPFRVDYCFASEKYFKILDIDIGKYGKWVDTKLSDHCPIVVDFEF